MNAAFFGLALVAALNPKLLAVDLLLIENRRPRAMFLCLLAGGLGLAIGIGFLDVFLLHADAVKSQGSFSAGFDLALGIPLMVTGMLVAAGRLHGRRRTPARPAAAKRESWPARVLREPRLGLAVLIGAVVGIPGASYITALHQLISGRSPTAVQAIAVILFAVIAFALVIVPFALLELRPEATRRGLQVTQGWIARHARQLIAIALIIAGAYMTVTGLIRLI